MWQHRHHQVIGMLVGLVLPTVLGALYNGWVGALGGFLVSGITRVVAVQHCTFLINSLCPHSWQSPLRLPDKRTG